MQVTTIATPQLAVNNGQATTTSNEVAQHFGKPHKDVLEKIATLVADLPSEFNERNFPLVHYTDAKGERRPAYRLTRDGFTLLAMGFTGKKALAFKLAYIEAFNHMEASLRSGPNPASDMLKVADLLTKTAKALRESGVPKQLALSMALDEVHTKTGVRMLPNYTPERVTKHNAHQQIVRYIQRAARYARDQRFGWLCAQGIMPHSKLLKLVAIPACEFANMIDQALNERVIQKIETSGYAGTAYTLRRQ